jgi:hypothetical protein
MVQSSCLTVKFHYIHNLHIVNTHDANVWIYVGIKTLKQSIKGYTHTYYHYHLIKLGTAYKTTECHNPKEYNVNNSHHVQIL